MSASRSTLFTDQCLFLTIFSALLAKRISEKKEKAAAIKASHKKCVSPCLNKSSAQSSWLMSNFQGCVNAGSCSGVSFVLYFLMQFRVMCGGIYSCPVSIHLMLPLIRTLYKLPQGYLHTVRAWVVDYPYDVKCRVWVKIVNTVDTE